MERRLFAPGWSEQSERRGPDREGTTETFSATANQRVAVIQGQAPEEATPSEPGGAD